MSIHSWSRSAYSYHHNTTSPAALSPGSTSGATATLTAAAGSTANAVFTVDTDYHYDPSINNSTSGTVYVMAKVDDATSNPTANIRINWRG